MSLRAAKRPTSALCSHSVVHTHASWACSVLLFAWVGGCMAAPARALPASPAVRAGPDSGAADWVSVPAGRLEMGACTPQVRRMAAQGLCVSFADALSVELPRHAVDVPRYAMARTEVTLAQFKRFIAEAGRTDLATPEFRRANAFGDLTPVTHVSWQDAQDYVAWLNQTQGPGHRLTTEAEWEHACRAGADPTFCGGDVAAPLAWTLEAQLDGPAAVATKTPNAWGLHDMSGNVWEWTQDCWNTSYHGAPTDGSAWLSGDCTGRVLRGGSLNEPVATIHEPIAPYAYTQFRCDVINSHTGQCINPPGTRALLGSLGHNGECVAVMEGDTHADSPRMGFMDCDGQWLGGCQWAGVLLFHENLAAVQDPDTLLWGYLNAQGRVAIAPQFAWPGFFNRKRAMVQVAWPSGQPRTGHGAFAWLLIDTQGHTLGGPWAQIDFAPGDHYVVQALADAGSDIWSLMDENGATLIDREPVPVGEKPDEADELEGSHGPFHVTLSPKEKAAQHLDALWKARRDSVAQSLRHLPLAERLAQLPPQTERDLAILGLWGQRVRCTRPVQSIALGPMAEQVGTLEFSYPVSLSLFNLAVEAPVTFVRADGSTVCVGVPWDGLELLDGDTPGTRGA